MTSRRRHPTAIAGGRTHRDRNPMAPLSNLAARDVETLVHPYINLSSFRETGPLIIERAHGVYVYDTEGKPYIEGMAGLEWRALVGANEELVNSAAEQIGL